MSTALFNTRDIESLVSGLRVLQTNTLLPATKSLSSAVLAYMNKTKVTQGFFTDRKVVVSCLIQKTTQTELETAFEALWPIISGTEGALVVTEAGVQRQYTATWSDFALKSVGKAWASFDLIFTCSDTYGYDTAATTLIDQSGITTQPNTLTMADVLGSAEWQVPIITLFISALTGGTNATVTVGNPATAQTISITRNWTAADQVEIDCQNRTVKVNGTLVAFTGAFPEYNPLALTTAGQSKVTVTDTLTTRTLRVLVTYYKRWA